MGNRMGCRMGCRNLEGKGMEGRWIPFLDSFLGSCAAFSLLDIPSLVLEISFF